MSRKIIAYEVLNNTDGLTLTEAVTQALKNGWEVYGFMHAIWSPNPSQPPNYGGTRLFQTVVQYADVEDTSKPTSTERKIEPEL